MNRISNENGFDNLENMQILNLSVLETNRLNLSKQIDCFN